MFTFFHVLLSLVGIVAGFVVAFGLTSRRFEGWTAVFLWTAVAKSGTGFLFPFHRFLPSRAVGILVTHSGGGPLRALHRSARRRVAPYLRNYRHGCVVPECFRPDRTAFHEGAGPCSVGSDPVGGAYDDAACCFWRSSLCSGSSPRSGSATSNSALRRMHKDGVSRSSRVVKRSGSS